MPGPTASEENHSLVRGHQPTMEVGHVDINTANDLAGDIAALLWQTIESKPDRSDLWLMLFDVYRSQGNRDGFRRAVKRARGDTAANPAMDWAAVDALWSAFNESEPLDPPAEEKAPSPPLEPAAPRQRRLGDMALGAGDTPLVRLAERYQALRQEPRFIDRLFGAIAATLQRPTPLVQLPLSTTTGDQARVFLKREDSRHTTPEFENAVAQAYIARQLQKSKLLCCNEFRQHSVAVAQVAAAQQMPCTIFLARQELKDHLALMVELTDLGAHVEITEEADARKVALQHWATVEEDTHFVHSLGAGPHAYSLLANDFQSLLGRETLMQYRKQAGARPTIPMLMAATQSRADSIGFILPFLRQPTVDLVLIEPAGGPAEKGTREAWSGAYRERRREQAWIKGTGRVGYPEVSVAEGHKAQQLLRDILKAEIPLDDARAVAYALRSAPNVAGRDIVVLVG